MTQIIESFSDSKVLFEIYNDGDCVIEVPNAGYYQLSSEVIKHISSKMNLIDEAIKAKKSDVDANKLLETNSSKKPLASFQLKLIEIPAVKNEPIKVAIQAEPKEKLKTSATAKNSKPLASIASGDAPLRRSITRLETGNWECLIQVGANVDKIRHVYEKRDQARSSKVENEIGSNGRIA